jgi:hypothetical protein
MAESFINFFSRRQVFTTYPFALSPAAFTVDAIEIADFSGGRKKVDP